MMAEKKDAVFRAVRLAYVGEGGKDEANLGDEVERILAFVGEVQLIDTGSAQDAGGAVNVFRDDAVTAESGVYREQMLAQAPAKFKNWFLSKKIL